MSTAMIENSSMPRSALRHRPIASDVQGQIVLQTRATKEKRAPHTTGGPPSVSRRSRHPLVIIGLSMLTTCLLLWFVQGFWSWGSMQLDTLRYGYPRTMHVDRAVGHEVGKTLSHFEGLNIKGQIYVLEIPGGNASNSRLLLGPHLFGLGADLERVTLTFQGNEQHPDLLVEVHGMQMHFHNTGKVYVAD